MVPNWMVIHPVVDVYIWIPASSDTRILLLSKSVTVKTNVCFFKELTTSHCQGRQKHVSSNPARDKVGCLEHSHQSNDPDSEFQIKAHFLNSDSPKCYKIHSLLENNPSSVQSEEQLAWQYYGIKQDRMSETEPIFPQLITLKMQLRVSGNMEEILPVKRLFDSITVKLMYNMTIPANTRKQSISKGSVFVASF